MKVIVQVIMKVSNQKKREGKGRKRKKERKRKTKRIGRKTNGPLQAKKRGKAKERPRASRRQRPRPKPKLKVGQNGKIIGLIQKAKTRESRRETKAKEKEREKEKEKENHRKVRVKENGTMSQHWSLKSHPFRFTPMVWHGIPIQRQRRCKGCATSTINKTRSTRVEFANLPLKTARPNI